ncbi:hypothetical protein YYC_05061 [Plasmodium yoelii 17X]|uniref:Lysophospholipase n=3 Tax=Plasmodium yoelii TaxID=5861 RepID=A0AAF0B1Q2_PLAYO|nr:lysophospholipase, putative [Plasmodium yoelii]ETB57265.1 hypothetical protein YYC_05061 [Plasmodium yoelii 17X]WBY55111.1 lysophospholipase [Plasmodium yoelii yoelii]CDU16365.1 lysophospholipase, putative [Plasmodium yoelii]VTZ72687.1 lysophospholipase, putative [Plasmodium yoelii]|eukprot:XP_022811496.1 lysophospholipase, putative [Plasmodium yoelii]
MEEIELNNPELRNTKCNLDGDPKTDWLCNKNGLLLKTYGWLVKNAIGIILLIHGFKSHTRLTFMKMNLKMPNNDEGLVVDTNNYYIYKDSWIEKFNQNGYSVYALDLQGHGESEAFENLRGNFSCYDDLVDDVIQYMYHIHDEISNDNQMDDTSNNIVTTKKKRLPMYIIGYSMGGNIALRILQLLKKEKEDNINDRDKNNYKKCNIMLDNSTNVNEIDNDMVENIINDMNNSNDHAIEDMNNTQLITNSNDYGSNNPYGSISATTNASTSDKDERCYNYLDKLNIKGCVSLSGMMRFKTIGNAGSNSYKYFCLPIIKFMSCIAPHVLIPPKLYYKKSKYIAKIYKRHKFLNDKGTNFKCISELIKATITLNCNINYMPKDIPLLFVHSTDDSICSYKGTISFYNKANVEKKELHIVEGMSHSTPKKPGNEDILKKIIDWISNLRRGDEDEKENEKEN